MGIINNIFIFQTMATTTTVVCVKKALLKEQGYEDFEDWSSRPNHEYIGRNMAFYVKGAVGSKWANPFAVKRYGLDKCLDLYRTWITTGINPISKKCRKEGPLLREIEQLRGKCLGCWCAPDDPCHGKVLVGFLTVNDNNSNNSKNTSSNDNYNESVSSEGRGMENQKTTTNRVETSDVNNSIKNNKRSSQSEATGQHTDKKRQKVSRRSIHKKRLEKKNEIKKKQINW